MHVAHPRRIACEMEQQRRRDVVWKIPDHANAGRKAREVEVERIGLVHGYFSGEFAIQLRGEIAIELDDLELADSRQQRPRQRALSWADFDEEIGSLGSKGIDETRQHAGIVQEML